MKKLNLVWNVYDYGHYDDVPKIFNVFKHSDFMETVEKLLKMELTKEEFAEQLRRKAMYYYWSKTEWECIITGNNPQISDKEVSRIITECYIEGHKGKNFHWSSAINLLDSEKIDVYDQLSLNWEHFVDYVWQFSKPYRRELKQAKEDKNVRT